MSRIQLDTSTDQLDSLHRSLDATRASSEFVKVERQALLNILLDHSRLAALHQNRIQEVSPAE